LDDVLKLYHSKHKIDVRLDARATVEIILTVMSKVLGWEHTLSDYEHKSVAATFSSQLQDLEQHCPDASNLVRVLAFLDPEGIPLEMLLTGTNAIVEAQQPPTQSPLAASLIALIHSQAPLHARMPFLTSRTVVWSHITPPLSPLYSASMI
jgi:hypothetical protein